jgi:hypothetical protein
VSAGLLSAAAGVVSAAAMAWYLAAAAWRRARPQRVAWLIFAADQAVIFADQWARGARGTLWILAPQAAGTAAVMVLSWRRGTGSITRRDVVLLGLVAAALGLRAAWPGTALALALAIGVELAGAAVSARGAWQLPGAEPAGSWLALALAGALDVAAARGHLLLAAYPASWVLMGIAVPAAALAGAARARRPRSGGCLIPPGLCQSRARADAAPGASLSPAPEGNDR